MITTWLLFQDVFYTLYYHDHLSRIPSPLMTLDRWFNNCNHAQPQDGCMEDIGWIWKVTIVDYLLGTLLLHQKNLLACCPCTHHWSQCPSSQCKETWSSWLWHAASHPPSHTPCSPSLVLSQESAPQWHPQTAVVYHGYKIGYNPALYWKFTKSRCICDVGIHLYIKKLQQQLCNEHNCSQTGWTHNTVVVGIINHLYISSCTVIGI